MNINDPNIYPEKYKFLDKHPPLSKVAFSSLETVVDSCELENEVSTEQMKEAILRAYGYSEKWKTRVRKMSDHQIFAVYNRLLSVGKIR